MEQIKIKSTCCKAHKKAIKKEERDKKSKKA